MRADGPCVGSASVKAPTSADDQLKYHLENVWPSEVSISGLNDVEAIDLNALGGEGGGEGQVRYPRWGERGGVVGGGGEGGGRGRGDISSGDWPSAATVSEPYRDLGRLTQRRDHRRHVSEGDAAVV